MFSVQTLLASLSAFLPSVRSRRSSALDDVTPSPLESPEKEDSGDLVKLPTATKRNQENTPDKREQAILEKLARLARVPVEAIFEFVLI